MKEMNNKGFLLAESLIVSTFVLTVLIFLFAQFNTLMTNHKRSYSYNSVDKIYDLGSMSDYLKYTNKDHDLMTRLTQQTAPYIILYDNYDDSESDGNCMNIDDSSNTCKNLAQAMGLKFLIYTSSDISYIKDYVRSKEDDKLKQDIRDFISKVEATKVLGKGRLIAKFEDDSFATVAINTTSDEEYKTIITYNINKFNDLNKWYYLPSADLDHKTLDYKAREVFNIDSFNEATLLNDVTVKANNEENSKMMYLTLFNPDVSLNTSSYNILFDYKVPDDVSGKITVKILRDEPGPPDVLSLLSSKPLSSNDNIQSAELAFNTNAEKVYFCIDYSGLNLDKDVKITFGNIRLIKNITASSVYGYQLQPSIYKYNFMGWRTEKDGSGILIDSGTKKYSRENQVLYALEQIDNNAEGN